MRVTLSHRLFVDHSQYYTGCSWPTICGVGGTPHEALEDAIEMLCQHLLKDDAIASVREYDNDEPDEPGELANIPGWDEDGNEVSWHCELTIEGLED